MFMPEPREYITPCFLNVFNQPFRVLWKCFTKKSFNTLWIFWLMFFMPEYLKHGPPHVEFAEALDYSNLPTMFEIFWHEKHPPKNPQSVKTFLGEALP